MTLPTFLGIGVPRSGTTWLASVLDSHPAAYMAPGKEIFFFNLHYGRGAAWYESLFPKEAGPYRALGEFTPEYLYCEACPARIAALAPGIKLILSVRNPIDRLYSHYGLRVRSAHYTGSFETFLTEEMIAFGFYSQKIRNYLNYFERDQLLILIFEQTIATHKAATVSQLAEFLGLDPAGFPEQAGAKDINRSYVPKARRAYDGYARTMQLLLKWRQHRLVKAIRRLHLERYFGEAGPLPPMREETRQRLHQLYQPEIEAMEALLGTTLAGWQ